MCADCLVIGRSSFSRSSHCVRSPMFAPTLPGGATIQTPSQKTIFCVVGGAQVSQMPKHTNVGKFYSSQQIITHWLTSQLARIT